MRCSGWSSLAISICSALVLAGTASAHVFGSPQFIPSGSTETITLDVPNERKAPMTSFVVKVEKGLEIEHAHPADGWEEDVTSDTATWSGGSLAGFQITKFLLSLKATAEPGPVAFQTELRYDSGAVVRWPVSLTVVPGNEKSQNLTLAAVVGLVGLLVVGAVAMLAWRRRTAPEVSQRP
jgi:uncharacterized protein YcnI